MVIELMDIFPLHFFVFSSIINKTLKSLLISDLKDISEDSQNLRVINAGSSTVAWHSPEIAFYLVYNFIGEPLFNVKGSVKKDKKFVEINFLYEFEQEVLENIEIILKKFSFSLTLKTSYEEIISPRESLKKQDVLNFIQKVAKRVFDTFNDENKTLKTVFLNKEEYEKIIATDKIELSELLKSLFYAVSSLARYKDLNKSGVQLKITHFTDKRKYSLNDFILKDIISLDIEVNNIT
jgi:hypothetical protein